MFGPDWRLEDDLKTVTVTFPTTPPVSLQLDAAGVDELLKNLGGFRALMKPAIPDGYSMAEKVEAIPNPRWVTEPDLLNGDSLLHIRDPRFGWLHYLIPRPEAEKLAQFLQKQVDTPLDKPGPDRAH